jgi:hypothetical protein
MLTLLLRAIERMQLVKTETAHCTAGDACSWACRTYGEMLSESVLPSLLAEETKSILRNEVMGKRNG